MAISLEVYLGERRGEDEGDWTNLIISGGNCDQGFTPVEDLPLSEGREEIGVLSIDCLCQSVTNARWSRPRLTHDALSTPHCSPLMSPIQFQPLLPLFTLYIQYSTWVSPSAQAEINLLLQLYLQRLTVETEQSSNRGHVDPVRRAV